MVRFLAGVLSVIAVGVLLIAYGLLSARAPALDGSAGAVYARPLLTADRVMMPEGAVHVASDPWFVQSGTSDHRLVVLAPTQPMAMSTAASAHPYVARSVGATAEPIQRTAPRRSVRPARSWKKTVAVIGGSSAAGAGVGALVGGKKGALIGAAIGGGAGTLYELKQD
jgi:hypothetical protein